MIFSYPLPTPPSRAVKAQEAVERLWAEKGTFHDFLIFLILSCTLGKKGTGVDAAVKHALKVQDTVLLELVTLEKMADRSGSDSNNAVLLEEGSAAESSSPLSNAVMDILSSARVPNEVLGPP